MTHDPKGGGEYIGIIVHVMCTYICNMVTLIIKVPHV
jgi:hypothetical protein